MHQLLLENIQHKKNENYIWTVEKVKHLKSKMNIDLLTGGSKGAFSSTILSNSSPKSWVLCKMNKDKLVKKKRMLSFLLELVS